MSADFCILHGYTLHYDMRSGFDICDLCEKENAMTTPESKAAKLLGRKGGRSKSEAKQSAARANGKLGGKPADLAILAEVLDDYLRLVGPDPDRTRRIDIAWKFLHQLTSC